MRRDLEHHLSYQPLKLKWVEGLPYTLTGAEAFVNNIGGAVWEELLRLAPKDDFFNVTRIARTLPSIRGYGYPDRYLRAVLLTVEATYAADPAAYASPPVIREGAQLRNVRIAPLIRIAPEKQRD